MAKTVLVTQDSERMLSLVGHGLAICGIWLSSTFVHKEELPSLCVEQSCELMSDSSVTS